MYFNFSFISLYIQYEVNGRDLTSIYVGITVDESICIYIIARSTRPTSGNFILFVEDKNETRKLWLHI